MSQLGTRYGIFLQIFERDSFDSPRALKYFWEANQYSKHCEFRNRKFNEPIVKIIKKLHYGMQILIFHRNIRLEFEVILLFTYALRNKLFYIFSKKKYFLNLLRYIKTYITWLSSADA